MTMSIANPRLLGIPNWTRFALLDNDQVEQWTEDLTGEQICSILQQVPIDSRSNANSLLAAVSLGDSIATRKLAHRLKGMAAGIGANRLAEVARAIEFGARDQVALDSFAEPLTAVLDETLVAVAALEAAISARN